MLRLVSTAHFGCLASYNFWRFSAFTGWLAGHDRVALAGFAIGFEAFGVGIGTAALPLLPALQTHATPPHSLRYSPVWPPYRAPFNASTGWLVEAMGWQNFFLLCALLAVPGMLLLFKVAPWRRKNGIIKTGRVHLGFLSLCPLCRSCSVVDAMFSHPNHIVYLCSWGFVHLSPCCNSNYFGYICII